MKLKPVSGSPRNKEPEARQCAFEARQREQEARLKAERDREAMKPSEMIDEILKKEYSKTME